MNEMSINGFICYPEDTTEDQVYDAFIEFLESKGWSFGGTTGMEDN